MKNFILLLVVAITLSACGPIEGKVRTGLMNAGLSKKQSTCMAPRMVDRLSITQLRRIASLGNFKDESLRAMGWDRFMHNVRALKDPEILGVVSSSAVVCAL